jgi:hypothetical protein
MDKATLDWINIIKSKTNDPKKEIKIKEENLRNF